MYSYFFYFSISARFALRRDKTSVIAGQQELDMRCLQILRATIHNEERRLPEDWHLHVSENAVKSYAIFTLCCLACLRIINNPYRYNKSIII